MTTIHHIFTQFMEALRPKSALIRSHFFAGGFLGAHLGWSWNEPQPINVNYTKTGSFCARIKHLAESLHWIKEPQKCFHE